MILCRLGTMICLSLYCYDVYLGVDDLDDKSYSITMVVNMLQNWSYRNYSNYIILKVFIYFFGSK